MLICLDSNPASSVFTVPYKNGDCLPAHPESLRDAGWVASEGMSQGSHCVMGYSPERRGLDSSAVR